MKKLKFLLSTTAEIPHNYADAIVGIGGMAPKRKFNTTITVTRILWGK